MKPFHELRRRSLTTIRVRALKHPGRYGDGNGLYLVVDPSGAKRWLLRTVALGRRRDIGLGSADLVSVADAREKATYYRRIAREGGDPIAAKRASRSKMPTFAEAAHSVHQQNEKAWKNVKHRAQWINTLKVHVFPAIGDRPIDQIDTPDILKVLSPIWLRRPETARRVKQRMGTVFDWARSSGLCSGENPVAGVAKGLPRQPDRQIHHRAMPYVEVGAFLRALNASDVTEGVKLALELLILTASRTAEVLEASWEEIDLDRSVWTIPAQRMKARREHRIPLARRCVEILQRAKELSGGTGYIFPGRIEGKPLSNMVFLMALRRLKVVATVHGFRSTFRDWAAERTNFPRDVCEAALAHTIRDKTEAAYRRSDLFEKRRNLMSAWAQCVSSSPAQVIALRSA